MRTNYLHNLKSFLREFQDIQEHARTGRRPARNRPSAPVEPRP